MRALLLFYPRLLARSAGRFAKGALGRKGKKSGEGGKGTGCRVKATDSADKTLARGEASRQTLVGTHTSELKGGRNSTEFVICTSAVFVRCILSVILFMQSNQLPRTPNCAGRNRESDISIFYAKGPPVRARTGR